MLDFSRFSHVSFDCYGTLIDWESGIVAALEPLLTAHGVKIGRNELLESYAEAEEWAERQSMDHGAAHRHRPYREILVQTIDVLGSQLGFAPREDERQQLANSLGDWPSFEDSTASLRRLSERFELVVLSNVDRDLFEATQRVLDVEFAAVITAQDLEIYKPSPLFFEMARERLQIGLESWLHVAQSRFHDIAPAQAFGLHTVHVDRRSGQGGDGATPPSSAVPDLTCTSLQELADLMLA